MKFNKYKVFRNTVVFNYLTVFVLFVLGKPLISGLLFFLTLISVYLWNNTNIGGSQKVQVVTKKTTKREK